MKKQAAKRERNYGIDLLRLVSMLFVVLLHSLLFGGVLNGAGDCYEAAWLLEVFAFGAVDIFGIISGFVGYREEKKPFKLKPFISIWGQGLFYSIAILAIVAIFNRGIITKTDVITNLSPVFHNTYWYLTAYLFLLLVMPLLNAWVRELTKEQCRRCVWALIALVTLLSFKDLFGLSGGYSAVWLMILYLIGALMKKGEFLVKFKKSWCVLIIAALTVVVWGVKMLDGKLGGGIVLIAIKPFAVSYVSPIVLFSAILWVKLFSTMKITKKKFIAAIEWAAPCAFGIFLLNSHPLIRVHYTPNWLSPINGMSGILTLLYVIAFSVAFCLIAIVIDKIRQIGVIGIKRLFSKRRQ